MKRRSFTKTVLAAGVGIAANPQRAIANKASGPVVISTWNHGLAANEAAWEILSANGTALDAVEQGVRVSESDPGVTSVGYGGWPDREGNVTLDACIMDAEGNAGSVGYLQNIMNPISVARLVMEKTDHVMIVGKGAKEFALANGFKEEDLLTDKARARWEQWKKDQKAEPTNTSEKKSPDEDHDTIGMVALDSAGNLSGACTTSGLAWKLPGRVGDSPIIGAGLFVDNEIGGASATGKGEAVIKIAGTHLVVEMMRQGYSPEEACKIAVERIIKKQKDHNSFQVGFLALNKDGQAGGYSLKKGFDYALHTGENRLIAAKYKLGD